MGVNARINLPNDVTILDVATVMGILAGLPTERSISGGAWKTRVSETTIKPTNFPEMVEIQLHGTMVDGKVDHSVFYHFEAEDPNTRLLMPKSTPFWLAVAQGLIDFFGGTLDYQDCDDIDTNYSREKPRPQNNPQNGQEWVTFQDDLHNIQMLTPEVLKNMEKFAAYL